MERKKLMEDNCSFCNNELADFNKQVFDNFKKLGIMPKNSPYFCKMCYRTFSRVRLLEEFLLNDEVKCSHCGEKYEHFRVLFDGRGYTAYCECKSCHNEIKITMSTYGHLEIEDKNQIQVATSV